MSTQDRRAGIDVEVDAQAAINLLKKFNETMQETISKMVELSKSVSKASSKMDTAVSQSIPKVSDLAKKQQELAKTASASATEQSSLARATKEETDATIRASNTADEMMQRRQKITRDTKAYRDEVQRTGNAEKELKRATDGVVTTLKEEGQTIRENINHRVTHNKLGQEVVDTTRKITTTTKEANKTIRETREIVERTVDGQKVFTDSIDETSNAMRRLQYITNVVRRFILYRVLYEMYRAFRQTIANIVNMVKTGITKTINLFKNAATSIFDFAKNAAMAAQNVTGLGHSMQYLAARTGTSLSALSKIDEQMQSLGVKTEGANKALIDFMRSGLDVERLVDLSDLARNIGLVTDKTTTEALDGLTKSIIGMRTRTLKSMRIGIDATTAYKKYAQAHEKAAKDLTTHEKQLAILNETLERGAAVFGMYETEAMKTARQLRELEVLEAKLSETVGKDMVGAYGHIVQIKTTFLKRITEEIQKGGQLYDTLRNISATMDVFAEGLKNAADALLPDVISGFEALGEYLQDLAWRGLQWGVDFITQYGTGIIRGATYIISAAARFVANALQFFFKPMSPPRIAPDIDIWGEETLNEWLRGFTNADFTILEGIQDPLKSILQVMVGQGRLAQDVLGPAYVELSGDIIKSLTETGKITRSVMKDLQGAVGEYAEDLTKLIEVQYQVALAVERVEAAERALEAFRKREQDLTLEMQEELAEYNRMLRAGAGSAALRAQRQKINGTIKEREETIEKRKAAEDELEIAEEGLEGLKEREALQERTLAQLIEFGQMLAKIEDKEKSLKDTISGVVDEQLKLFDKDWFADVDLAFEELKNTLRDKFQEITAPLKEWWFGTPMQIMDAMGNIIEIPGMPPISTGARDVFVESLKTLKELADSDVLPSIASSLETIAVKLEKIGNWLEKRHEKVKKIAEEEAKIYERIEETSGLDFPRVYRRKALEDFEKGINLGVELEKLGTPDFDFKRLLGAWWETIVPEWLKRGQEDATAYVSGLTSEDAKTEIARGISQFKGFQVPPLATFALSWLGWGTNAATSWAAGILQGRPNVQLALKTSQAEQIKMLTNTAGKYQAWGKTASAYYADGIRKAKPQVDAAVKEIMNVPDVIVKVKRQFTDDGEHKPEYSQQPVYQSPTLTSGSSQSGNTVNINMNAEVSSDMDTYETSARIVETVKRELIR